MATLLLRGVLAGLLASIVSTTTAIASPYSSAIPHHNSYTFTFKELEPAPFKESNQQPFFRASLCFKKKPGVTEAFFHQYWQTVHADRSMSSKGFTVNLLRYDQFHQDQNARDAIAPLLKSGMKLIDFDGCAEFQSKDADTFLKFVAGLSNDLYVDQNNFLDTNFGLHIMAGYDNLIYGSGIKTSSGTDGILPGDHRLKNS